MQNSIVMMFAFSVFDRKYPFFENMIQRIKIVNLSWMQNSMVLWYFTLLDRKYPFWVNLFQKMKIINLSWNSAQRLIRIWRIHWWSSLLLFSIRNTFLGQILYQNKNHLFKLNFGTKTYSNIQNWIVVFTFSTLGWQHPFRANLVQKK